MESTLSDHDSILLNALKKLYPNHDYQLSTIESDHPEIHKAILLNAQKAQMAPLKYLASIGFKKIKPAKSIDGEINYDISTMNLLFNDYPIKQVDLAALLGCTRANISLKKATGNSQNDGCWIIPLNDEELDYICKKLRSGKDHHANSEFSFQLLRSRKDFQKMVILLKNRSIIKVAFELPTAILLALAEGNLANHTEDELNLLSNLFNIWNNQGSAYSDSLRLISLSKREKVPIKKYVKWKCLTLNKYLEKEGYQLDDHRFLSDEEILEKIRLYSDNNHIIHLKSDDEDYNFFESRAFRNKQKIYQFFESYGYKYERGHNVGDTNLKHRELIASRYVVKDNLIYISSYDPFYGTLHSYAIHNGKNMDEYINSLGFVRITKEKALPDNYIPYDYTQSLANSPKMDDKLISNALSLISNEKKEVFLDYYSYLYWKLYLKSKIEKMSITSLISKYGYTRVFEQITPQDFRSNDADSLEDDYNTFIQTQLDKLSALESKYSLDDTSEQRIHRNQQLVETLKSLYQGKCQLCSPETMLPPIITSDESIYCEVHHITSLHNASSDEDIKYIDSYKNTIVLCPYHHRFVHYHHGGFRKLISRNGKLYLENELNEQIEIYTNYHL